MFRYALVKNNVVNNIVIADSDSVLNPSASGFDLAIKIEDHPQPVGIGWTYDPAINDFSAPPAPVVAPPAPVTMITRLAFMERFTDAEAIAIDLASQGTTTQAAAMRRYQAKVNAATFIDLSRDDTKAGVNGLEAIGLLAKGRAAEILTNPVQPSEMYKG